MIRSGDGWRRASIGRAFLTLFSLAVIAAGHGSAVRGDDPPVAVESEAVGDAAKHDFKTRFKAACDELQRRKMPAIVAISHKDGPIVVREFGALRDDGIPPESTQIDVNSITKTVTAVMILKLVEQGKLRLDETLGGLFKNVPEDKAAITVHQLLTHTAGFREAVGSDEEQLSRDTFVDRAFRSKLKYAPGRYSYSNVGFGILAATIEMRTGKSYEDYLQQDVLAGLGFKNIGYTSVYDDARSMRSRRGRTIEQASWGGHDASWHLIGNGGMIATADEFIRFRQAVKSGKIVSQESLELSQTPHIGEDFVGMSHYGYGLVVQKLRGVGTFYWHDGGNGAFSAQWNDFTEQGDLIFTAGPDDTAFEAMSLLVELLYDHKGGLP